MACYTPPYCVPYSQIFQFPDAVDTDIVDCGFRYLAIWFRARRLLDTSANGDWRCGLRFGAICYHSAFDGYTNSWSCIVLPYIKLAACISDGHR